MQDQPVTLRADACPYQVVVLCSCGARLAATQAGPAWSLASRHALDVHGDRAAYQAAAKYARQHRKAKA